MRPQKINNTQNFQTLRKAVTTMASLTKDKYTEVQNSSFNFHMLYRATINILNIGFVHQK
jgi:hypothetical protein